MHTIASVSHSMSILQGLFILFLSKNADVPQCAKNANRYLSFKKNRIGPNV